MFFLAAIPSLATLVEVIVLTITTTVVAKVVSDIYDTNVAPKEKAPD